MFFGSQPHIYESSKGEGRLNAAFANVVPMEMAVSFHCVQGCAVGGGRLKWRVNGNGKGQSDEKDAACFMLSSLLLVVPLYSCLLVPKDISTFLLVVLLF